MRAIVLIIVLMNLMLVSCEKTVILDLDQAPQKVVIEATLTNEFRTHRVKVSRTLDFYQSGRAPLIRDAVVYITDDAGNRFDFRHNPEGDAAWDGFYYSEHQFAGIVGRTYTLHVLVDGEQYTATDELLRVTSIDSLTQGINFREFLNPRTAGRYYEVLMYAKEPQETKDYYFFKFFRNDSAIFVGPTDIYFADDEILGEEINGIPSPVLYMKGDVARVEMYSLTRTGYLFYNDLFNLINNDGGMFGSPPVNPRTNVTNGALGFFQVSGVTKESLVIQ